VCTSVKKIQTLNPVAENAGLPIKHSPKPPVSIISVEIISRISITVRHALQEDVRMRLISSTTTEQNIINSIIDASETELIRHHQDLWVMREAFKKLVTEFVGSQHDTDVD
jgi:hypothetical protein